VSVRFAFGAEEAAEAHGDGAGEQLGQTADDD
jgi:hypothetical protein